MSNVPHPGQPSRTTKKPEDGGATAMQLRQVSPETGSSAGAVDTIVAEPPSNSRAARRTVLEQLLASPALAIEHALFHWQRCASISEAPARNTAALLIKEAFLSGSKTLTLSGLSTLPPCLDKLNSLHSLRISNGAIETLPLLPPHLEQLEVHSTHLTQLPFLPSSLKTLDVGDNFLQSLPALPGSLEIINAAYNCLTDLPASITELSAPRFVNLEGNPLTDSTITNVNARLKARPGTPLTMYRAAPVESYGNQPGMFIVTPQADLAVALAEEAALWHTLDQQTEDEVVEQCRLWELARERAACSSPKDRSLAFLRFLIALRQTAEFENAPSRPHLVGRVAALLIDIAPDAALQAHIFTVTTELFVDAHMAPIQVIDHLELQQQYFAACQTSYRTADLIEFAQKQCEIDGLVSDKDSLTDYLLDWTPWLMHLDKLAEPALRDATLRCKQTQERLRLELAVCDSQRQAACMLAGEGSAAVQLYELRQTMLTDQLATVAADLLVPIREALTNKLLARESSSSADE